MGLLALAPALLMTLLFARATDFFTMRAPRGPDAMGLVALYLLPCIGWVCTLIAALAAVRRGSLDWISPAAGVPTIAVLATGAGLALLSLFAAGVSMEVRFPARTLYGVAGGLALPLLTQGFVLALLLTDPEALRGVRWPRAAGGTLAALAGIALAGALVMWVQSAAAQAQREEAGRQEAEEQRKVDAVREVERTAAENAELDRMPDDAPLPAFLSRLFIDKTGAHNAYAARRIRALPGLTERLAERLADPAPIQREYAANFIRMCDAPDPAWVPSVRKAILMLAADYRANRLITHVLGLTRGMLLTAARFEGAPFRAEVEELRSTLEGYPPSADRDEAVRLAGEYLAGRPVKR